MIHEVVMTCLCTLVVIQSTAECLKTNRGRQQPQRQYDHEVKSGGRTTYLNFTIPWSGKRKPLDVLSKTLGQGISQLVKSYEAPKVVVGTRVISPPTETVKYPVTKRKCGQLYKEKCGNTRKKCPPFKRNLGSVTELPRTTLSYHWVQGENRLFWRPYTKKSPDPSIEPVAPTERPRNIPVTVAEGPRSPCKCNCPCKIADGYFGEVFTKAVEYVLNYGVKSIDCITFPKEPDTSVIVYPGNIASVVWGESNKVVDFFYPKKESKQKTNAVAAFSSALSNALESINTHFKKAVQILDNCFSLTPQSFPLDDGSRIDTGNGSWCGTGNLSWMDNVNVSEDPKGDTITSRLPVNAAAQKVHAKYLTPHGKPMPMVINIDNLNLDANVVFNKGQSEVSYKELNIDATNPEDILMEIDGKVLDRGETKKMETKIGNYLMNELTKRMQKVEHEVTDYATGKKR